jgi:hypothetical protein
MKLKIIHNIITPAIASLSLLLVSCGDKEKAADTETKPDAKAAHGDHDDHDDHDDHGDEEEDHADHDHGDEVALGKFDIDGIMVEAAQGHGSVEAGKEGHIIIKLDYKDDGQTVTRAWIGTADRTMSAVGKGEYAPSHDDYDIHANAPDPLPEGAAWWLEIEKPDGTKAVGSIPLLKDIKK